MFPVTPAVPYWNIKDYDFRFVSAVSHRCPKRTRPFVKKNDEEDKEIGFQTENNLLGRWHKGKYEEKKNTEWRKGDTEVHAGVKMNV